ncbi:MAG: peroxiredoxin-like family protein [Alphaproteobacteria bacterium]|jgi:peroxiredoxin|nr:peroxiredoxin-like family protein [Alphaproteobacteria bacterium]
MSAFIPPERPVNANLEQARAMDAPLSARLAAYDAMLTESRPASAAAYGKLVDHLIKYDVGGAVLKIGTTLPAFLLPDETGTLVSSDVLLQQGPLVISFNRGNWCPYCTLELDALQASHAVIQKSGSTLVSITPEIATFNRRLKNRLALDFPVLTDLDNGYALEAGLAVMLTPEIMAVYEQANIQIAAFQRNAGSILPIPATVLVDRQGTIRHSFVNADFRLRFDPDALHDALAELA